MTTRDATVQAAIDAYRASVAATFSLTVEDLDAKVTVFLQSQQDGGGTVCVPGSGSGGGRGGRR